MKFGKIYGRFFLKQHLDQLDDDTPDLCTISELIETYPMWSEWIHHVPEKRVQLYTMFETSDVHPDIIEEMKLFEKVIEIGRRGLEWLCWSDRVRMWWCT